MAIVKVGKTKTEFVVKMHSMFHFCDNLDQVLKLLLLERQLQETQLFQEKCEMTTILNTDDGWLTFTPPTEIELKPFNPDAPKLIKEIDIISETVIKRLKYSETQVNTLKQWIRDKVYDIVAETPVHDRKQTERLQLEIIGRIV